MENQNEEKRENKSLRRKIKPTIIIALLVIVGFWIGGTIGVTAYLEKYKPYLREKKLIAEGQKYKEYMNQIHQYDNLGGDTPEETVDLFIEALKKEDYDLASKYFVAEEQEKAIKNIKTGNKVKIIEELEYAKKNWEKESQDENRIEFWYNKKDADVSRDIVLRKINTNKWKISRINVYYLGF